MKNARGFSLIEILIAFGIVGILAMFTVPKLLATQSPVASAGSYKNSAQAAAFAVAEAFQAYKFANGSISPTASFNQISPYLNYVKVDTTSTLDTSYNHSSSATAICGQSGQGACLVMHTGGIIRYFFNYQFTDGSPTSSSSGFFFIYDPDIGSYSTSTIGPGKAVKFFLYADGRVRENNNIDSNTTWWQGSTWYHANPSSTETPPWFSWN